MVLCDQLHPQKPDAAACVSISSKMLSLSLILLLLGDHRRISREGLRKDGLDVPIATLEVDLE